MSSSITVPTPAARPAARSAARPAARPGRAPRAALLGLALLAAAGSAPAALAQPAPGAAPAPAARARAAEPLAPDNAAVLLIDHQAGLLLTVQTQPHDVLVNNTLALAKTAKLYDLPVVLTTSGAEGPNGPLLPSLRQLFPGAPLVDRTMYFDSMSDPAFAAAVAKTGRKKLIMAGITTDYCLALPAITAARLGYDVYAVVDASGAWSSLIEQTAITRMAQAGVHVTTWAALLAELQSNLAVKNPQAAKKNQLKIVQLFSEHLAPVRLMIEGSRSTALRGK